MTEHAPRSGAVDMIRPEGAGISGEEIDEMVIYGGEPEAARGAGGDGPLRDLSLAGVGSLSEILGQEEARQFVAGIKRTRSYLYERALKRWGPPSTHQVKIGSAGDQSGDCQ